MKQSHFLFVVQQVFVNEFKSVLEEGMMKEVLLKLTSAAFDECVSKPSSKLSSLEKSCIRAIVGKQLEATQLVQSSLQSNGAASSGGDWWGEIQIQGNTEVLSDQI